MKKKLCKISAILILALLFSCSGEKKDVSLKLIPVKSGENYQYIDQEGKIIINPQFREASLFRNGLALVETSGDKPKWGFISEDGKFVIAANYKSATVFSEGLAWVISENAAPTAINTKGEIKITLKDAQYVRIFNEGLAAFCIMDTSGNKWGFVDKDGKTKINPQFSSTGNFNNGRCAVKNKDGKWGYIDKEGKIVINYQFATAKEFNNGKAVVEFDNKYGLIDEDGKYVINPQYKDMIADNNIYLIEQDKKWGWCDKDGKITINPQFDEAYPFLDNDMAPVKSGESWGYIDKSGKMTINPQFDGAFSFNGKLALVLSAKKIGFIKKDGKYAINPQFDQISYDLIIYMLNGSTEFERVETDYINIAAITDRIKKDITENTVTGMNFTTPMSTIMSKYNKSQNDFNRYSQEHLIISNEKISNNVTLDFSIFCRPWALQPNYDYQFNMNAPADGFKYRINLSGSAYDKVDNIFNSFEIAFTGFKKDAGQSNANLMILKSNALAITIVKSSGSIYIQIIDLKLEMQNEMYRGQQAIMDSINKANAYRY